MQTVSMLEFRRDARKIIGQLQKGQPMVLTYRGTPVARLEPIQQAAVEKNDPFYGLADLADAKGRSLTNTQMDRIVYGT